MNHKSPYSIEQCQENADLILGTINAPRPVPIDAETLWRCIKDTIVPAEWLPHLTALYEEVGIYPIHDAVLCDFVNFSELNITAINLGVESTEQVIWIAEMAYFDKRREETENQPINP